jgi:hypothetical protein
MKHTNLLLISLALISFNAVASNSLPVKQVSIPFKKQAISSSTHSGLSFDYDMNWIEGMNRKIVCKVSSSNDFSWFEFKNKGVVKKSFALGGDFTVIFIRGDKERSRELYSIYQADPVGNMKINGQHGEYSSTVSCDYDYMLK